MKDYQKQQEFIKHRAQNLSFDKISKEIGVSKPTLIKWDRKLNKNIAELKADNWEALRTEYLWASEARLKSLSEVIKKITKEIDNRDLSDTPTSRLLDLYLKFNKHLSEETKDDPYTNKTKSQVYNESRDTDALLAESVEIIKKHEAVNKNHSMANRLRSLPKVN